MKILLAVLTCIAGVCSSRPGVAQVQPANRSLAPTPLAQLIEEARQKNPEIQAAMHGYEASRNMVKAAGSLPETQLMLQQLNVGSPRPFAGYTNSDFAYIGIGASQEFPWPGKRALRSQVAGFEADSLRAQSGAVERAVTEQVKTTYFRLAALQQTLTVLERDDKLLAEIGQIAESRYRVGQGSQQEVLKAQLQHTKILQEINLHHREVGQLQVELKEALGRTQDSVDVVTEPLYQRALPASSSELLDKAKQQNPEIRSRELLLSKAEKQSELARKEFRPDFGVQYVYQNTDRKFRDYYMMTLSVTLPNRGRRKAELAQAVANRQSAAAELQSETQRRLAEVQNQYVLAQTSAEQLKIYREGLMPQAQATFQAAMAAYQSNRQDFETLMSSFLDVLKFEEEYQKELGDYESALARLESLTGVTLP